MFTYIVPLVGVSVHSGAGSLVVGSVGSLVGSLVVVSVGAVDVFSTLEITVLELLIVVETSELALSTLETAEDTTELSVLVSLALQPESKIAEVKKTVKNFAFFIIFCPFQ